MAQAVLSRRGRRPFRGSKLILGWALFAALLAFLVLAAIGLAKSASVAGRWILSLGDRQREPAAAPNELPAPPEPPVAPPTPPPRVVAGPPSILPAAEAEQAEAGEGGAPPISAPEPVPPEAAPAP